MQLHKSFEKEAFVLCKCFCCLQLFKYTCYEIICMEEKVAIINRPVASRHEKVKKAGKSKVCVHCADIVMIL